MFASRMGLAKTFRPLMAALMLISAVQLSAKTVSNPQAMFSADADWKFALDDPADEETPNFDDVSWRTLVVLRTARTAGEIKLTATSDGLNSSSIVIESKLATGFALELR